ncbi:hypothetical protein NUW54_g12962 [Trametes sanguinea]|uniref:Uncharacterized protein n=1 Tax=Trametes sanguinea TaxID=158606 RepID=A0ACC1MRK0_9APHY|nr:hypothetical protein NUW54_g12962 [Trametes sanguinea]
MAVVTARFDGTTGEMAPQNGFGNGFPDVGWKLEGYTYHDDDDGDGDGCGGTQMSLGANPLWCLTTGPERSERRAGCAGGRADVHRPKCGECGSELEALAAAPAECWFGVLITEDGLSGIPNIMCKDARARQMRYTHPDDFYRALTI